MSSSLALVLVFLLVLVLVFLFVSVLVFLLVSVLVLLLVVLVSVVAVVPCDLWAWCALAHSPPSSRPASGRFTSHSRVVSWVVTRPTVPPCRLLWRSGLDRRAAGPAWRPIGSWKRAPGPFAVCSASEKGVEGGGWGSALPWLLPAVQQRGDRGGAGPNTVLRAQIWRAES